MVQVCPTWGSAVPPVTHAALNTAAASRSQSVARAGAASAGRAGDRDLHEPALGGTQDDDRSRLTAQTELGELDVTYVDLPTGHWPMFSRPADLAAVITTAARA